MTARDNDRNNRVRWLGAWTAVIAVTFVGAVLTSGSGCDDKRDSALPPQLPTSAPVVAVATRPTTEELTGGPRQTIKLSSPFLTMEIPKSWKNVTTENATWIEGYTPHGGPVRLLMATSPASLKDGTVNAMEKKAKAEAAAHPDQLTIVPLHPVGGGAKAMERRQTQSSVVTRDDGTTDRAMTVDWLIEIFVPSEKDFSLELLHFNNIPVGQYLEDKQFLEQLVSTLRYEPGSGGLK